MKTTYSTDREIKALKPAASWYDVKDDKARNLIVRVGPVNGKGDFRRTFCMVTRFPGSKNPVRHSFGEYGEISLEQARELAGSWRALIRQGIDPREERKRREEAAKAKDAEAASRNKMAFGVVIEDYLARRVKGQRRAEAVEREIRSELIPHWKDRHIAEITRIEVKRLIAAIAARPAPYHAHNVFGHVRTFFNWALDEFEDQSVLTSSPCERIKPKSLIGEKKARQRVLSEDEIVSLWRASGRLGYPYSPLFRLLAITGQRKSEVAEARWREFHPELVKMLRERSPGHSIDWSKVDPKWTVWTIPPDRFKSDRTHMVPLSVEALEVLESLPHWSGRSTGDHLFSTSFGQKPVNGFSKAKERLDKLMLRTLRAIARKRREQPAAATLPDYVIHDIRRTVRTRLSELRVQPEIAEAVIGHSKKGLTATYNQYEYLDEKREALDKWAARLRSIVSPPPSNVVPLQARAR